MNSVLVIATPHLCKNHASNLQNGRLAGIEHIWFAQGKNDAVRSIRKLRPSLVILDVNLASGLDFEIFEGTKDITYMKIIICETDNYAFKILRFGIDDYLVAPVGEAEIATSVEKLLFQKKQYKIQELYRSRCRKNAATLSTVFIDTLQAKAMVSTTDIIRIQDLGDRRLLILANGSNVDTLTPMVSLLSILAGNFFARVSHDHAINCRQIIDLHSRRNRLHVRMVDGKSLRLPLSLEGRIRERFPRNKDITSEQSPID